ncbi:unnamed protein product [Ceutorhynchus assimilis]|uniref:Kinesin motor domain-containing protein n=1 Tax=Ceutorhynchus assimilis TaxID=467358 RepID=A0A9P0DK76_9CUCU|nr:unnamed protein product [Ceutorhynchus assimilis]
MSLKKRIFFKICPTETVDVENIKLDLKNNIIYVRPPEDNNREFGRERVNYWVFPNDGIFKNISQESVYHTVKDGVLENVLSGNNALIMVFGQKGSGKTFTTTGLNLTEKDFGILPRITEDLLKMIDIKPPESIKILMYVSYVEFHNDYAIDLLKDRPNKMNIHIRDQIRKIPITSMFDALKCIFIAEARKSCIKRNGKYYSNSASTVATFQIIQQNMNWTDLPKTSSRLHVVDLVGTDCTDNDKNPKERGLANLIKSKLEMFLLLLSNDQEKKAKLNKRMTAFIHYLADDISNQTCLRFLGNIKGRKEDLPIVLSLLRFGNIFQGLKPKKQAIEFDMTQKAKEACLQNEIMAIEKEKYLNSIVGRKKLDYQTDLQGMKHLNDLVDQYLECTIEEMPLMSFSNIKTVLNRLKDIYKDYVKEFDKMKAAEMARKRSDTSLKKGILSKKNIVEEIKTKGSIQEKEQRHLSIVSGCSIRIVPMSNSLKREKMKKPAKSHVKRSKDSSSKKKSNASSAGKIKKEEKVRQDKIDKKDKKYKMDKKNKKGKKDEKGKRSRKDKKLVYKASKEKTTLSRLWTSLPDDEQEIWNKFSLSPFCKDGIINLYQLNEMDVKTSLHDYFKAEQMRMEQTVEKSCDANEFDKQGNSTSPIIKPLNGDNFDEAQETVLMLRERSLTAYAVLKIYLRNRDDIAKTIQTKFDNFCFENYRARSPDVKAVEDRLAEFTVDINEEQAYLECNGLVEVPEATETTIMIRNLQRLMRYERAKRRKLLAEMDREWKQF